MEITTPNFESRKRKSRDDLQESDEDVTPKNNQNKKRKKSANYSSGDAENKATEFCKELQR